MISASLWVPFYIDVMGWSLETMFQVQMIFQAFLIILEVPSGYFADKFGRNRMVGVAAFAYSIGTFLYSQATSIPAVILSELFLAIASSLLTGAGEALLVDNMYKFGFSETERQNELSLYNSVIGMAYGISAPIGSLLVNFFTIRQIMMIGSLTYLTSFVVTLIIGKTQGEKINRELKLIKFFIMVKEIITNGKGNRILILAAVDMIILWGFMPTFYIANVMFLKALGVPLMFWGFYSLISNIIPFFIVKKLNPVVERYNRKNFNLILTAVASAMFFLFCHVNAIVLVVLYVIFYTVTNFKFGMLSTEINNELAPETRSTALSMVNLCSAFIRIGFYGTLGVLAETNLEHFSLWGSIILLILALSMFVLRAILIPKKVYRESNEIRDLTVNKNL